MIILNWFQQLHTEMQSTRSSKDVDQKCGGESSFECCKFMKRSLKDWLSGHMYFTCAMVF